MNSISAILSLGLILAVTVLSPCLAGDRLSEYAFDADTTIRWKLPRRLTEISGLTTASEDRLFAHDDERGVIYQVDYKRERLAKAFAIGKPSIKADFEGLAFAGGRFYLVTSDGLLYEAEEGQDGDHVLFTSYETRVGQKCEIEGLAYEPTGHTLLLLCKKARDKALKGQLVIFRWSLRERRLTDESPILVPLEKVRSKLGIDTFRPSGIERHPSSGTLFILDSKSAAIVEVTLAGQILGARSLPRKHHRQPEGIAISSDLTLYISDEGGRKKARLSAYRPSDPD